MFKLASSTARQIPRTFRIPMHGHVWTNASESQVRYLQKSENVNRWLALNFLNFPQSLVFIGHDEGGMKGYFLACVHSRQVVAGPQMAEETRYILSLFWERLRLRTLFYHFKHVE